MLIPVGFGQATLVYSGATLPFGAANVWGFENVSEQSASDCAARIVTVLDDIGWHDLRVTNSVLDKVMVKLGPTDDGPTGEAVADADGTASGTTGNSSSSLLCHKHTNFGGRKSRGRIYVPSISESVIDIGGSIESTFLSAAEEVVGDLQPALLSQDVPMVLLHNTESPAPYNVITISVDPIIANQRDRQRR